MPSSALCVARRGPLDRGADPGSDDRHEQDDEGHRGQPWVTPARRRATPALQADRHGGPDDEREPGQDRDDVAVRLIADDQDRHHPDQHPAEPEHEHRPRRRPQHGRPVEPGKDAPDRGPDGRGQPEGRRESAGAVVVTEVPDHVRQDVHDGARDGAGRVDVEGVLQPLWVRQDEDDQPADRHDDDRRDGRPDDGPKPASMDAQDCRAAEQAGGSRRSNSVSRRARTRGRGRPRCPTDAVGRDRCAAAGRPPRRARRRPSAQHGQPAVEHRE